MTVDLRGRLRQKMIEAEATDAAEAQAIYEVDREDEWAHVIATHARNGASNGKAHAAVETTESPDAIPARTSFTAAELIAARRAGEIAPRPFLLDGLLRAGDGLVVFGPAGLGKSQLGVNIAVALAAGGRAVPFALPDSMSPMFAVTSSDPVSTLYVAGEDEPADFAERLEAHLAARMLAPGELALTFQFPTVDDRNLMSSTSVEKLFAHVQALDARVIVLDNLSTLTPGLEKSEECPVRGWLDLVPERLKREGRTVVVLGHSGKGTANGDAREALDRLFGSYAWGAWASGAVMLDWVKGNRTQRRLIHAKSRGTAEFESMLVERAGGDCMFQIIGPSSEFDTTPRSGRPSKVTAADLRRALEPAGTWKTKPELLELLDVADSTFREHFPTWRAELGGALEERAGLTVRSPKCYRLRPPEPSARDRAAGGVE